MQMELKKIPSFQNRSILVPQKTNIGLDIIPNNDTKFKDKTKNSLKRIIQKHQNNIPKLIQLENDVINKSLPIPHKIFSDAIIEAFLDNSSTGLIPSNDYSESTIFYNRIHEEMNRIHQRANGNLTNEQRQQLVHIAITMDVPKLARRIVKENTELFLESKECNSFLTDSLIIEDISSPDNKPNSNFDVDNNNAVITGINKSKLGIIDSNNDDAQFCKAFDEVDRIRKRIIQKASKPQQSVVLLTSSAHLISSSISNDIGCLDDVSKSILIQMSEEEEEEDHKLVTNTPVVSNNHNHNENIPKSLTSITDSNSNSSLQYLESTNKVDASITGTFHAEDFINILDSSKSSSDVNIQSMQSTFLSRNINNSSSTILEPSTSTPPISKHNNEIALSLDSLIGSRSNSMYSANNNKQQKQLGSESLYNLQHQLECVVNSSPTNSNYYSDNNHKTPPPSSIGTAMLFHGTERTEFSMASENKMFVSPINYQYMNSNNSSIDQDQELTNNSSHEKFSPLLINTTTKTTANNNNISTIHHLPDNPFLSTQQQPPFVANCTSPYVIARSNDNNNCNMSVNKDFIDDSLSKLIAEETNIIAVTGKSNFDLQYNYNNSVTNQDSNDGIKDSMKCTKPPLRSSIERYSTDIDHTNNNLTNKRSINDFSFSSTAASIDGSFDSNMIISSSKTIHLGAKLLLASPLTSWLPSHMSNRSIETNSIDTTSKSMKSSRLSKDLHHFSSSEVPILPKIHPDNDIDQHIQIISQSSNSKMMIKSKNQSSIDNVQKSLLILNEHLLQFDQSTSSITSTKLHSRIMNDCIINESQDKFAAISEYLPTIAPQYSKYDDIPSTTISSRINTDTPVNKTNPISRHNSNISNFSDVSSQQSEDAYVYDDDDIDICCDTPVSISVINTQDCHQKELLKKTFSNNSIESSIFNNHNTNSHPSSSSVPNNCTTISGNIDVNVAGMLHEIDNVIVNAKSRNSRDNAAANDNITSNSSGSNRSKSRLRNCIQKSLEMNQNGINTNNNTNNNTSNNSNTNTSILSKASQRREVLAAALDAGDAVGKLMAEMMIVSNR